MHIMYVDESGTEEEVKDYQKIPESPAVLYHRIYGSIENKSAIIKKTLNFYDLCLKNKQDGDPPSSLQKIRALVLKKNGEVILEVPVQWSFERGGFLTGVEVGTRAS